MKILFFIGIGVAFGELYAAIHAAQQFRKAGHEVEFAFVCNEPILIDQILGAGFDVIDNLGLTPKVQAFIQGKVSESKEFEIKLKSLISGPHDIIYLIDYHHFFMFPEFNPSFEQHYTMLQEELTKTSKRLWTSDHALSALDPHPFPQFGRMIPPPPPSIEKLFLPAPPHFNRYEASLNSASAIASSSKISHLEQW